MNRLKKWLVETYLPAYTRVAMQEEQERLQEQQTIDRAKWVLVDQRKMSEPDAHRYIEKSAMDRCVRKIRIAEEILRDS